MADHACVTLHFYLAEQGALRIVSDDIQALELESFDLDALAQELGRIVVHQASRRLAPLPSDET